MGFVLWVFLFVGFVVTFFLSFFLWGCCGGVWCLLLWVLCGWWKTQDEEIILHSQNLSSKLSVSELYTC